MTTAEKFQQVAQKFAQIGGANEVLEWQLADAAAQQHPQIFIIERRKASAGAPQQAEAISMKGRGAQPVSRVWSKDAQNSLSQFVGRVIAISDGENFFQLGQAAPNEPRNALHQHRGLAGTGAGAHQHGSALVPNGLELFGVEIQRGHAGPLCGRAWRAAMWKIT